MCDAPREDSTCGVHRFEVSFPSNAFECVWFLKIGLHGVICCVCCTLCRCFFSGSMMNRSPKPQHPQPLPRSWCRRRHWPRSSLLLRHRRQPETLVRICRCRPGFIIG